MDWKPCELRNCGVECRHTDCDKRSRAQKKYRVARFNVQTRILQKMNPKSGVIFLSRFSEEILRANIPFEYDAYWVRNPIETDWNEAICNPAFEERDIDCLFVGRVEPEKDCALFCRVCSKLGVCAVVVGDGTQRAELEREYPAVKFVGKKSAGEVRGFYQRARVFVFCSSCYEVAPLVIREAQLSGVVPIALRGGTAGVDYVRDGVDGIVVAYDDEDGLADAVRRMLNPAVNNRMRAAVAAADYSAHRNDVFARRMEAIYEEFLGTREMR